MILWPIKYSGDSDDLNFANLYKCDFSYRCAATHEISTDIVRRAIPLR